LELNFRKAQFSEAYVRALAAVAGCSAAKPEPDCDSKDLVLSAKLRNSRIRSPKLAIQVKCSAILERRDAGIAYPLPLKNYDDLRPENLAVPRILVVIEVPPGEDSRVWLEHSPERLCLLRGAFWVSLHGHRSTLNTTTVTVFLPLEQRLTAESLEAIMVRIGNGVKP
jgi:Domain of unknown function (DUF4365)